MSNPGNTGPQPGVVGGFAPLNSGLLIPAQYLPPPSAASPILAGLTAPFGPGSQAEAVFLNASVPSASFGLGASFRAKVWGNTFTVTNNIFHVRVGPNGTTADADIVSVTFATDAGAPFNFEVEILVTVTTIGGAGVGRMIGSARVITPGGSTLAKCIVVNATAAAVAINTTIANFVNLTASGSAGGPYQINNALIEYA